MKWSKNKERNESIVKMFAQLGSTRLVADKLGMNLKTVQHVLHSHGVATPRSGRRQYPYAACDRNPEIVLKMCAEGATLDEMGRAVGTKGAEVKKFLRRQGVTKEFPKAFCGERHHAWKGRLVDKDGYVLIHCKNHPNGRKHTPYIFEHRLAMEESLGRFLEPNEVVHHRNGIKDDNRIENLQLFQSNGEHLAVDLKGRCPNWSEDGMERIRKANLQRWSRWRESNHFPSKADGSPCI